MKMKMTSTIPSPLLWVGLFITITTIVTLQERLFVDAAPKSDLVDGTTLPGWNKETPSQWFSGYLDVVSRTHHSGQKRLHYMFIEAEAPADPGTSPVIVWLNGGPGCSSLEGFFYEHGPLVVADAQAPPNINYDGADSTNKDKGNALVRNVWAWSKVANVIYLEAPAGVGFSYSTNEEDYNTGDNQTAADNLSALQVFFDDDHFPEYRKNPLYISGESYGGVYVPTLSLKIYESGTLPQMAGFLVGNGVFDWEDNIKTHVPFAYGHGFVSTKAYQAVMETCSKGGGFVNPTPECKQLIHDEVDKNMVDVNWYDAYRTCYHPNADVNDGDEDSSDIGDTSIDPRDYPFHLSNFIAMSNSQHQHQQQQQQQQQQQPQHSWVQQLHMMATRRRVWSSAAPSLVSGVSVPCINSDLGTKYLNNLATQKALHVDESHKQWQVRGGVNYQSDGVFPSMVAVYREILSKWNPRILVYNGDVDAACNYLWAEVSVAKLGPRLVEDWRPWVYGTDQNVGEQLGGYITTYDRNISFATIHGAGHMSPQWRPEAAFSMLRSFLDETTFPMPREMKQQRITRRQQQQQQRQQSHEEVALAE